MSRIQIPATVEAAPAGLSKPCLKLLKSNWGSVSESLPHGQHKPGCPLRDTSVFREH